VWQSAWIGGAFAGLGISCLFSGWIMNKVGRKHMLVIGTALNCIGIGLLQASSEWKLWLFGKMVNAAGFGFTYTMSPVWYSLNEIQLTSGLGKTPHPRSVASIFACWMQGLFLASSSSCMSPTGKPINQKCHLSRDLHNPRKMGIYDTDCSSIYLPNFLAHCLPIFPRVTLLAY
jgi:MFS family permease